MESALYGQPSTLSCDNAPCITAAKAGAKPEAKCLLQIADEVRAYKNKHSNWHSTKAMKARVG